MMRPASVVWVVVSGLLVAAAYGAGHFRRLAIDDGPATVAASGAVIVGSRLQAAGERGARSDQSFDRLRIPTDTTELQLSFLVETPARGARFETELEPVDRAGAILAFPTIVEPLTRGEIAKVTVPALPDGDYVLRLRRIAGSEADVITTRAFRLTRDGHAALVR